MADPTPIRDDAIVDWPAPPDAAVYHGVAGEIVRALDPHTEADPVGVLVSVLAAVGNVVGTNPHLILDHARHGLRVWPILVGPTGTGRKGTALAAAGTILGRALPAWWETRGGGLSTGEGVIWEVRDPIVEREAIRDPKSKVVLKHEDVIIDAGVADKRRFLVESEFGGVLQVLARDKNNLSAILRKAWDGDPLTTMTKSNRAKATGAHITITGHITPEEVRELLAARELANGLGNRFLWVCVRRSKLLPFGSDPDEGAIVGLSEVLRSIVDRGSEFGRFTLTDDAAVTWERIYGALANDEPGVIGQLASRNAPTIMRLAGIYAVLDESPVIAVPHLDAALSLWDYSAASIRYVFTPTATTPTIPVAPVAKPTDTQRRAVLFFLADKSATKTEISTQVFKRNLGGPQLSGLLHALVEAGLISATRARPDGGVGATATTFDLTEQGRRAVSNA